MRLYPGFKMKIGFYILLSGLPALALATGAFAEVLSEQDIYSVFREGNDLFRQANAAESGDEAKGLYGEAILRYERVESEGNIKNAGLYYNLGNAYLLKGDIGRAILNYRRSEKLDGSDHHIKKNLAFARSRRVDKVAVKIEKKVLQTLFFWHYDFSMKVRFLFACLFFGLVFVLLTVRLWFGRRSGLRAGCIICSLLFFCFTGSVLIESVIDSNRSAGVIISESVMARQGDGHNYPPSFKDPLHAGTEFDLIKTQSGWYNIQLADGSEGWVPAGSAEQI